MRPSFVTSLLFTALTSGCEIPDEPALSNNVTEPFGIRVQNASYPIIHNRFLNLDQAGGGDQHLYLSPFGNYSFDIVLSSGVIQWRDISAVINGEVS